MSLKQEYTCPCGHRVVVGFSAKPLHCNALMKPGNYHMDSQLKLHFVALKDKTGHDWKSGVDPVTVSEFWKLHIGRHGKNSEQFGWIAEFKTHFEWKSMPGVSSLINSGICGDVHQACMCLMAALEGGVFARAAIKEITESLVV